MFFFKLPELVTFVENMYFSEYECLMVLMGEESVGDIDKLTMEMDRLNIRFFGGVFPGLLVGNREIRGGFIVEKFETLYSGLVMPHMFQVDISKLQAQSGTVIILADGLSGMLRYMITPLAQKLGDSFTYIGGGAGYSDMKHRSCIFDNFGFYQNVMYVCVIPNAVHISVEHGWLPLQGPFYVKQSVDNKLMQLDQRSAFEVYSHVIEEEEHFVITRDDFFRFAKDHPFGIAQEDGSFIVRDLISVDERGHIVCVADIPEGSNIYVLKGDVQTLLDASLRVARECAAYDGNDGIIMVFDCISRQMFLGNRFTCELENIQSAIHQTIQGALSVGEFAISVEGKLIIHNKSTIIGMIDKSSADSN